MAPQKLAGEDAAAIATPQFLRHRAEAIRRLALSALDEQFRTVALGVADRYEEDAIALEAGVSATASACCMPSAA